MGRANTGARAVRARTRFGRRFRKGGVRRFGQAEVGVKPARAARRFAPAVVAQAAAQKQQPACGDLVVAAVFRHIHGAVRHADEHVEVRRPVHVEKVFGGGEDVAVEKIRQVQPV